MNQFTKEDLELISYCFENISLRKFRDNENIQPLYIKIRAMIDNYCDHDYKPIDNDFIVKHIEVCAKCGNHKS